MDKVTKIAGDLCFTAAHETQQAIMDSRTNSMAGALYISALAALGPIQVMASIVGVAPPGKDSKDPERRCNPDALLFSVLLINKICPEGPGEKGGSEAAFGPEVYFQALEAFEKLTGRRPDESLQKELTANARKIADEAAVPLSQFMTARSASKTQ